VRPDNALRMNYDYECITITTLRKPSPHLTHAPGFASGATERTGAAFRPDGAMIQDQGPDPREVLQQVGGGRAVAPLRTPQNGSGGVKTGYGGGAPMQAPPVQPEGRLFAPDGRHAAPEAPAPCRPTPRPAPAAGGVRRQAPQRRTTAGDRIAEARASTGLTHPMHQTHRRRRAPGRPPPPAQVPPAGRPAASKEAGHGKANGPALTRVSCNHESLCHLRVLLVV
jgi:hypothetical protein